MEPAGQKEQRGVFGGTFDPIHKGHLAMAHVVCKARGLGRILLMPAFIPPHKPGELTPVHHRLEMARIACKGEEGIEVSDLEACREGISYTVDTLEELLRDHPGVEWSFIIGGDSIPDLPSWQELPRLFRLARVIAVNRPGHPHRFHQDLFPRTSPDVLARCERDRVEMEPVPIASRDVRQAVRDGKPFDHLLPHGVGEYIRVHGLYGYPSPVHHSRGGET